MKPRAEQFTARELADAACVYRAAKRNPEKAIFMGLMSRRDYGRACRAVILIAKVEERAVMLKASGMRIVQRTVFSLN